MVTHQHLHGSPLNSIHRELVFMSSVCTFSQPAESLGKPRGDETIPPLRKTSKTFGAAVCLVFLEMHKKERKKEVGRWWCSSGRADGGEIEGGGA